MSRSRKKQRNYWDDYSDFDDEPFHKKDDKRREKKRKKESRFRELESDDFDINLTKY